MFNILIADDNIYYAKMLMDYINKKYDDIRVCNITIDGEETLNLLNNTDNIDIFLLDLKMPIYTGIEILDKLDECKKNKYKNSCIVISGENEMINQIIDNNIVYDYINKNRNLSDIINHISNLIQYKKESNITETINYNIDKEFKLLKFNFKYVGTRYLKECIFYIIKYKNRNFENLKKEVYPIIAKKHGKTIHNVKCNINTSINAMYYDCKTEILLDYFSFTQDYKPTIKTIINTILNNI